MHFSVTQQLKTYRRLGFKFIFKEFKRSVLSALGFIQLKNIYVGVSHNCNANCVHCYEKFPNKKTMHLSTEQVYDIVNQFHKINGRMVRFCSGEFLLRDDKFEIIRYIRNKGLLVSITSNGLLLNEKMINDLKAADISELIVSIDSANPKIHDKLRGVESCFDKAVNGLRMAKEKGISTQIWTYLTKETKFQELEDVIKIGYDLDVHFILVFFVTISGRYFNDFERNLTVEEKDAFRKEFSHRPKVLFEFPTEESMCRAGGKDHINIMPSGDMTYCPSVPYSYGNIKDMSIKEGIKLMRKDYHKFNYKCKGECIIHFKEYRESSNGTFMYK